MSFIKEIKSTNRSYVSTRRGYSIKFNWFDPNFQWLNGDTYLYDLSDTAPNLFSGMDIWDRIARYPYEVWKIVNRYFKVDLASGDVETLRQWFFDTGLLESNMHPKKLPWSVKKNIDNHVMFVSNHFAKFV